MLYVMTEVFLRYRNIAKQEAISAKDIRDFKKVCRTFIITWPLVHWTLCTYPSTLLVVGLQGPIISITLALWQAHNVGQTQWAPSLCLCLGS